MMSYSTPIEPLEGRRLFNAAASVTRSIGVTAGVHADDVVPTFTAMHGTVHDSAGNALDDSDTGVDLDTAIKISFDSNGTGSIDSSHLYRTAVLVTDTTTGVALNSNSDLSKVITSGGGDVIIISLKSLLTANHSYSVELNAPSVTTKIRTVSNGTNHFFDDTTFTFTAGTYYAHPSADFTSAFATAVSQTNAGNHGFTCVTMGPDGKLYAADSEGYIYKYTIGSDGTLAAPTTYDTVRQNNGGARLITGIAFSPLAKSTDTPVLYVSHSAYQFGNDGTDGAGVQDYAANFSGKISVVSGENLDGYQDFVVNLPRSAKDHTNNQIVFSPDGRAVYFGMAAMNAMGRADSTWGNRVENIYTGTILQLRLGSAPNGINTYIHATGGAVNLLIDGTNATATGLVAGTTHYNIFKGSNPLRIYADGIRNDYDMVFATNGHLYAAINGSSAGGNTPATPSDLSTVPTQNRPDKEINGATYSGPAAPGLTSVQTVEEDTLLDVKNGAYYGHPNAARGEYVLDGGNPTSGTDPYEIIGASGYAVGQQPDRNYTLPAYDFGQDYSPDGIIQYKSVGGKDVDLNGYLLVCRYSSGGDILALKPDATTGAIDKVQARIPGLTNLGTPLDVTEDTATGNVYVAVLTDELGSGSIQLLKPTTQGVSAAAATPSTGRLVFNVKPGHSVATRSVTITNSGSADLTFDPAASRIGGSGRRNFAFVDFPSGVSTIAPGDSLTLNISGQLLKGQTETVGATLYLKTNDPARDDGIVSVLLRATNANVTA